MRHRAHGHPFLGHSPEESTDLHIPHLFARFATCDPFPRVLLAAPKGNCGKKTGRVSRWSGPDTVKRRIKRVRPMSKKK